MKDMENYIKAVSRRLNLPKDVKHRVMSDFESSIHARQESGQTDAQILAELVEKVWPKVAAGEVKPTIFKVLPITQAEDAHDLLYKSASAGKVILTVE